ncbi:hypothetical protein BS78_01G422100 [Paspalum vaginatum]|nr:hypothetical protein BS78_01G422100 [Paspalum vaginatum]
MALQRFHWHGVIAASCLVRCRSRWCPARRALPCRGPRLLRLPGARARPSGSAPAGRRSGQPPSQPTSRATQLGKILTIGSANVISTHTLSFGVATDGRPETATTCLPQRRSRCVAGPRRASARPRPRRRVRSSMATSTIPHAPRACGTGSDPASWVIRRPARAGPPPENTPFVPATGHGGWRAVHRIEEVGVGVVEQNHLGIGFVYAS